jgi:exodeoxyribonuclease VII small subunit
MEQISVETLSYEQAFSELEKVVAELEEGRASLEEAIALFERGQTLSQQCMTLLDAAELRVRQINPAGAVPSEGEA